MKIREIKKTEPEIMKQASLLISKYSWGEEYPVKPIDEIKEAHFMVGAFSKKDLVGFASVSKKHKSGQVRY